MAPKLLSWACFEACWVVFCPDVCSYSCLVCGGGGGGDHSFLNGMRRTAFETVPCQPFFGCTESFLKVVTTQRFQATRHALKLSAAPVLDVQSHKIERAAALKELYLVHYGRCRGCLVATRISLESEGRKSAFFFANFSLHFLPVSCNFCPGNSLWGVVTCGHKLWV